MSVMSITNARGLIKKLMTDKNTRLRLIFTLGIAGMALILLSDILPNKKAQPPPQENTSRQSLDETEQYRSSLESQLAEIIEGINGAGNAKVMITVGSTREYVYAEKSDIDRSTRTGEESSRSKGEPVMNGDSPVLRKILSPQVSGAAVVCEGASDPATRERIINTVAAVLGLPSSRISVEPMSGSSKERQF